MIDRAARSRSAVSSTTTGGLPGPATIARLPLLIAARATAGAAGDADQVHVAVLEDRVGRFQRRLGDHADQVVDAQVAVDRLVEAPDAFGRHAFAAGMRIDDHRVAGRDHADRVAGDRRQRVRDRRDRADHAERGVFDHGQAVVAAEHLAAQELDARRPLAERLELLDLVLEPADLGLFHLHRAQLDTLVDGDPANVADDAFAVFESALGELLERFPRGGDRFVRVVKNPVAAREARAGHAEPYDRLPPALGQPRHESELR